MSSYAKTLLPEVQKRYIEKLASLGFENIDTDDPYLPDKPAKLRSSDSPLWSDDNRKWPSVEFGSVYVYLIDTPGPFTRENMQAYKSLNAYDFFVDGWVHTCYMRSSKTGFCIIKGKVNRSQAVTDKPHEAWVAIQMKDGMIECGHCSCMAGLGEVCSHMAAILFKVEANTRLGYNQVSCTSMPCVWNQTFTKKVEGVPLSEINFEKPSRVPKPETKHTCIFSRPKQKELKIDDPAGLLNDLKQTAPNAVIFTVTNPQRPVAKDPKLPINVTTLYNAGNCSLDSDKFRQLCDDKFNELSVTSEQSNNLEKATRNQSKSGLWHQFRAGRLTTSLFYDVTRTDIRNPSKSLLKKVMNYDQPFSNAATAWGLSMEGVAIEEYVKVVRDKHSNFRVTKSGFVINTVYPHLGSSPDGVVSCDCCGTGTIEVKSPYKFKDTEPCSINASDFFLKDHSKTQTICAASLRKDHKFYYQVQGQMGICNLQYCDFICYTTVGLHIERVSFDKEFFDELVTKLTGFYKACVLPELLTRVLKQSNLKPNNKDVSCICGMDNSQGAMVTCSSEHCLIKYYHMKCVGLKVAPKTKWLCLTCRPAKRTKKN